MLAVVVLCILVVVAVALAGQQQRGRGMMGRRGEMAGGPGTPGRQGMGMMGGMMERGALAVASEGVYVLAGNRLLKYDHDLNLLKETRVLMPPPRQMGPGPEGGLEPPVE